jgi:nucleoside phosphorylase
MKPPRFLLCFAVKEEAAFIPSGFHQVLLTGMGPQNARESLLQFLSRDKPDLVLSCGFAGGLNINLTPSSVIFQTSSHAPGSLNDQLSKAGACPARFHTSHRVATTVEEKKQLWQTTGADAVEMESGPIMEVCREHEIPSAIVRVISDTAGESLPLDFNRLMTPQQTLSMTRLIGAVLASPGTIPGLMRLNKRTRQAARQLAQVLAALKWDG